MARRSDHSRDEIREMALSAAERIIVEHGHDGLTARKVAIEIGYTVGTLYLVFDNLDDLIIHINGRTLDRLNQRMADGNTQNLTPVDRLIRLGQIYIHFAYRDPHRWSLIFKHPLSEDHTMPDWYAEKFMRVFAMVEESIRPLAPHRKKIEISRAASALWAGIYGICVLGITRKLRNVGEKSVQDLARSMIVNYLSGFTSKQAC